VSERVAPAAGRTGHPIRIGVTGPIGCGKTQVIRWLSELGVAVVDADAVARAVTAPGHPAHDVILRRFGPAVTAPDGTLDRAALGRIVFSDAAALRELEAIVHPAVRPRILEAMDAAERNGAPAVAIEAIKLVEGGLATLCDEVWLVICDEADQRRRLMQRSTTRADADQRIAAQAGLADRLRPAATRVLDTTGDAAAARAMVVAALAESIAAAR
jgi:dephospho-CoA kinase